MPGPTTLWLDTVPARYLRGGRGNATSTAHADAGLVVVRPMPPARS